MGGGRKEKGGTVYPKKGGRKSITISRRCPYRKRERKGGGDKKRRDALAFCRAEKSKRNERKKGIKKGGIDRGGGNPICTLESSIGREEKKRKKKQGDGWNIEKNRRLSFPSQPKKGSGDWRGGKQEAKLRGSIEPFHEKKEGKGKRKGVKNTNAREAMLKPQFLRKKPRDRKGSHNSRPKPPRIEFAWRGG